MVHDEGTLTSFVAAEPRDRRSTGAPAPRGHRLIAALCAVLAAGFATSARADSSTIDFENPPYVTGNINGQDGWSGTGGIPNGGTYDYEVASTVPFGSPPGFAAQSFRISNAVTSGSFGDWAFSKSLADEAGEPTADNGGFSGGTRQPHFEVSFDITSATGGPQPGLQISVAPDRGDGARMSFLRFRDTPGGIDVDFADYQDVAPFGTSASLLDGCSGADDFVTTTIASGLSQSAPHNIRLVIDFVPGPRNDVVRVFIDGVLVHCGTTWEDYYRYCPESQPPVDVSRTVDSLLLQARSGGGTAPGTLGNGFLVDNLNLTSSSLNAAPAVCPNAVVQCAAPSCAAPNCFVDDATGVDTAGCCASATPCKTIQFAVGDAAVGDTISVAAGTYLEPGSPGSPTNINKTVTLCGANAGVDARGPRGPETDIADPQGIVVNADNVVIDGFTIEGDTSPIWVYGLDMGQGTTGTQVYNNIVQNNIAGIGLANTGVSANPVLICQNLIQNNNVPGPASGTGIYTDEFVCGNVGGTRPCVNFVIENNSFLGQSDAGIDISNTDSAAAAFIDIGSNLFDGSRAVLLFITDVVTIHNNTITNANTLAGSGAIRLFGGCDDVSITNNDMNTGNMWAIRMTDSGFGPCANVEIHENNIANFAGAGGPFGGGLFVGTGSHVGPVDATCNWWNDPCGPFNVFTNPTGIGQEVFEEGGSGTALFSPWLIAPGPAPAAGSGICTGTMCAATTSSTIATTTTSSFSTTSTVTTSSTVTTLQSSCGNAIVESGEQCDPPGSPCTTSPGGAFGICTPNCQCIGVTTSTVNTTTSSIVTTTINTTTSSIVTTSSSIATTTSSVVTTSSSIATTSSTVATTTSSTIAQSTTTTVATTTTTSSTICVPTPENTSLACGDMIDNDCDGLVDCQDPDCSGIFPCPRASKDPTIIVFGHNGKPDRIKGHAKLTMAAVDLTKMPVSVLLSDQHGTIYANSLPAGALSGSGSVFIYRNSAARSSGGMYEVKIKRNKDGATYTFSFTAYGNLSGAKDAHMRLQFYIGSDANAAAEGRVFITIDTPWTQTPHGWRAPKDH